MSAIGDWREIDDTRSKVSRSLTVDQWTIEWGRRGRAAIAEMETALAERDEAITLAYRLWLQGASDDIGEHLAPFWANICAHAEKGSRE